MKDDETNPSMKLVLSVLFLLLAPVTVASQVTCSQFCEDTFTYEGNIFESNGGCVSACATCKGDKTKPVCMCKLLNEEICKSGCTYKNFGQCVKAFTNGVLPTKTIDVGGTPVILTVTSSTPEASVVTIENSGTFELTPNIMSITPIGEGALPIIFDLPLPVEVTPEAGLIITEFIVFQLAAAVDATASLGRRRRLDSPGCDLFPDAPCNLGCCAVHDQCYAENGCSAASWARTVCEPLLTANALPGIVGLGPIGTVACVASLFFISGECSHCNNIALACIATGCSGITEADTSEICYDNKCNTEFECPGTCDFISLSDTACCGCVTPGASCGSPTNCGNGVCDFGESTANCFVDCAFNTCPGIGEFDCSGTCVNPKSDPNNCGACGIVCPGGSPCVLGSCSTPFAISWTSTTYGLENPAGKGWQISNDGLTIRFVIEDSNNCGGSNDNIQGGAATANIDVTEAFELTALIVGISELQDTGFENMSVFLDGTKIVDATSQGLDLGCAMGPSIINFLVPQPIILTPGSHEFVIEFDTGDSLYHVNAYYELNLIFVPTSF